MTARNSLTQVSSTHNNVEDSSKYIRKTKDAILIYFLLYGCCIVPIDFVDLKYIGIHTKIVSL
jgi:hypothetical protein